MKTKLWASAGLLLVALVGSGCASRQLVGFQTHPDEEVMLMQTLEHQNYLLWSDHEHAFWSCSEQGQALRCERRCGGDSDLACPEAVIFAYGAGSNVR